MKYIKKYNEKLSPEIYLSAASKLKELGHKNRPAELEKWGKDLLDKKTKMEMEKMGIYSIILDNNFTPNSLNNRDILNKPKLNVYITLSVDVNVIDDDIDAWKEDDQKEMFLYFNIGLMPADVESNTLLSEYNIVNKMGWVKDKNESGFYWANSLLAINLSLPRMSIAEDKYFIGSTGYFTNSITRDANITKKYFDFYGIKDKSDVYFEFVPNSDISISDNGFYFADRRNALKFKNALKSIFKGDIVIGNTKKIPGGVKEIIMDELCSEREVSFEEFIRFIKSINMISLNKLYK